MNPADYLPEQRKSRPRKAAQSGFPGNSSNNHGQKCGDPQIAPADTEHYIQPDMKTDGAEKQVAEYGSPGAQGAQKIIPQTQDCSHSKAQQKTPGGKNRYGHPSRRRQLKVCRGSS